MDLSVSLVTSTPIHSLPCVWNKPILYIDWLLDWWMDLVFDMFIFLCWLPDFRGFPRINSLLSILRFSLDTLKEFADKPSDFHEDHFRALKKGKVIASQNWHFTVHFLFCWVPYICNFQPQDQYNSSILKLILYKLREHNPGIACIFLIHNMAQR